jgi:hypothetical protein
MRKNTVRLIVAGSAVYFTVLLFSRGLFASGYEPRLYLLVAPLLLLLVILAGDLASRATTPRETPAGLVTGRVMSMEVQHLTRQIQVASRASRSYFENVLLSRLRNILLEKACLETGICREKVQGLLGDPGLGPGFLKDPELYRLLYTPAGATGQARVSLLLEAVRRVEAWKP